MTREEVISKIAQLCAVALGEGRLNPETFSGLDSQSWMEMCQIASSHGVLPLMFRGMESLPGDYAPPKSILRRAFGALNSSEKGYCQRMEVMKKLCAVLGGQGIDVMFLKGATLCGLYPEPALRPFNDIDFYLFGDAERGEAVMASAGIACKDYFHHHTQASLGGVMIEHHYDFLDRLNHRCNHELDDALKKLAEEDGRKCPMELGAGCPENAYRPSATMDAIFLMRHASAHFAAETVPLRMLYDWALFNKYRGLEVDWSYVRTLYSHSGLSEFASILDWIIVNRLHLPWTSGLENADSSRAEMVWKSIAGSETEAVKRKGLSKCWHELKVFAGNKWKHDLVYPGESYLLLALRYLNSHIALGR